MRRIDALALGSACALLGACAPGAAPLVKTPANGHSSRAHAAAPAAADDSGETTYFPQQATRRGVDKSFDISLDDLPVGQIADPSATIAQSAPFTIPADAKTPAGYQLEAIADGGYNPYGVPGYKAYAIRAKSLLFGEVRVAQQYQGGTLDGSATVYCGRGVSQYEGGYYGYHIMPVHVEGIARDGDNLLFTMQDGWFDSDTCRVQMMEPSSTSLGEIIPGLLYGYRSCSHAGRPAVFTSVSSGPNPYPDRLDHCDDPDRVNFVFPRANAVATTHPTAAPAAPATSVSRVSLPIRQGVGSSATAAIPYAELTKWSHAFDAPERKTPTSNDTFVMAIELEQSSNDRTPNAIVFLGGNDAADLANIPQVRRPRVRPL